MEVDNPEYLIHEIFSSNFWKGPSARPPDSGHEADYSRFRSRQGGEILPPVTTRHEHPDYGGRQSEARRTGASWRKIISTI